MKTEKKPGEAANMKTEKKPTHPLEVFMDGKQGIGKFTHEEFESARALIWAAPDLLEAAKFQQAYDESEPWAIEDVDRMLADNEGRDYRTPSQVFLFLRGAAIAKVEGR